VPEPRSPAARPRWWPHFSSTLRATAVTARLGRVLGIAIAICFVTGLLSEKQYHPLTWLPWPATPVWIYRVTQGVHVLVGTACIPLVLVKLWSVYPNLWRFPPLASVRNALERASVAVLVAATLVQLVTGFINSLDWYPFGFYFVDVHHYLAWVVTGSVVLHVAVKLPEIVHGLRTRVADDDVLTEVPPEEHSLDDAGGAPEPVLAPATPGLSRRGVLVAAGAGIGVVVLTTAGQSVTPLEPVGLLAMRQWHRGPQGVPVNRTAEGAQVVDLAQDPGWSLQVDGTSSFRLGIADLEPAATAEGRFPIACVEGWSVGASWRGLRLIDLVRRAGGDASSTVLLESLEPFGLYRTSTIAGPQLVAALLATHLNGRRLDVDHGYPLRLIAPDRAGVLNTKWLSRLEVR